MTWKRCEGCTRAISSAALTCEYCGRPWDNGQAGTPADVSDQDKFAWPPHDPQPGSTTSYPAADSPQGLPALELNSSFPFTEVEDQPLQEEPGSVFVATTADAILLDDELDDEPDRMTPTASTARVTPPAGVRSSDAPAPTSAKKAVGPRKIAMLGGALVAAGALIVTILSMRP